MSVASLASSCIESDARPRDVGPIDTAEELSWEDFVHLITAQSGFVVPPSVRRLHASRALEEFTLPPMLRDVFSALSTYGLLQLNADPRASLDDDLLFCMGSL